MNTQDIKSRILSSVNIKTEILHNESLINTIEEISLCIVDAYRNGKKVLFCGNGGSAADAQHLAAEFTGRYYLDRAPLFAEALHVNTSYLTAISNDYSYYDAYARLVKAFGTEGDILVALSTSGSSDNILNAISAAKDIGMKTIGLTGKTGGEMKDICDYLINIPSSDTPRIQEAHILVGHIICEAVEKELFANK